MITLYGGFQTGPEKFGTLAHGLSVCPGSSDKETPSFRLCLRAVEVGQMCHASILLESLSSNGFGRATHLPLAFFSTDNRYYVKSVRNTLRYCALRYTITPRALTGMMPARVLF